MVDVCFLGVLFYCWVINLIKLSCGFSSGNISDRNGEIIQTGNSPMITAEAF
jgi:hypothetical protein